MDEDLAGAVGSAGLDRQHHAGSQGCLVDGFVRREFGHHLAEAVAESADVAKRDTSGFEHGGLGVEHIGCGVARDGSGNPGLGRLPQRLMDASCRFRRRADRDVAVEVAVVPGILRAGVDEQNVAALEAAVGWPLDDAGSVGPWMMLE